MAKRGALITYKGRNPGLDDGQSSTGLFGLGSKFNENLSNGTYLWSTKDEMDYQDYLQRQNWQRENAYNSPAAQMQRYRLAGLNPDLIYGQSNTAGSIGTVDIPQSSPAARTAGVAMDIMQKSLNAQSLQSQVDLNKSLAKKADAEAVKASADTELSAARTNQVIQSTLPKALYQSLAQSQIDQYNANVELYTSRISTELTQQSVNLSQARILELNAQCQEIKNQFTAAHEEYALQLQFEQIGLTHAEAKEASARATEIIETLPWRIHYLQASTAQLRAAAANQSAQVALAGSSAALNEQRVSYMKQQGENIQSQIWYRQKMAQTLYKDIFDGLAYKNLMVIDDDTGLYKHANQSAVWLQATDIVLDKATQDLGRVVHFGFGDYQHQNNTPVSSKVRETQSWTDKSGRKHTVSRHRDPKD